MRYIVFVETKQTNILLSREKVPKGKKVYCKPIKR